MTTRRPFVRQFRLAAVLSASALGWVLLAELGPTACPAQAVQAQSDGARKLPQYVLIIRHAEKPDDPHDIDLSDRGKERAQRLSELFVKSADRPTPFPEPNFIFATHNSDESHRPVDTVTPLSMVLNIPINDEYKDKTTTDDNKGIQDLAHEIRHNPTYAGKSILVCWHHGTIPEIAQALKVKNAPAKWKSMVFDRVWQISYDAEGKPAFTDLPQQLLTGDSQQ